MNLLKLMSLCLLTLPGLASAHNLMVCDNGATLNWPNPTRTLRPAEVSFPAGSAVLESLQTAVARFNQNPSNFRFSLGGSVQTVGLGNLRSEVLFTDEDWAYPAAAWITYSCVLGLITDADVAFHVDEDWTTSMTATRHWGYGGDFRPFQNSVLQELGYAIGLGHEDDEYNIMGTSSRHMHVNGNTARSYFGEDASVGAMALYGVRIPRIEDLSVSHWKYSGTDGEYATHTKTQVYSSQGVALPLQGGGHRVASGQTIRVEFTYENNGGTQQNNRRVGLYLSTDNVIQTTDQRLGTFNVTLGRNSVYTMMRSITLPAGLQSGQRYWIGAIIDDNGQLAEVSEANNATWLPLYVP